KTKSSGERIGATGDINYRCALDWMNCPNQRCEECNDPAPRQIDCKAQQKFLRKDEKCDRRCSVPKNVYQMIRSGSKSEGCVIECVSEALKRPVKVGG